jgi:hypothetical protein
VCAYLPAEKVARTTGPVMVQSGFALAPVAVPVTAIRRWFDALSVDTGPPPLGGFSSFLVLKI